MIVFPSLSVLPLEAMSLNLRIMGARLMNGKLLWSFDLFERFPCMAVLASLVSLPWSCGKSSQVLGDDALQCMFLKLC